MNKKQYFEIIKSLVNDIKHTSGILNNPKYLLNKVIREYAEQYKEIFVSAKAYKLFSTLSKDKLADKKSCLYFLANNLKTKIKLNTYINMCHKPKVKTFKPMSRVNFKDLFIIEHIVPISTIVDNLVEIPKLSYKKIEAEMNKLKVACILCEEDRKIDSKYKSKRPDNYKQVIKTIYKKAGIKILKNKIS